MSNFKSRYQSRRLRHAMSIAWEHKKNRAAMKHYTTWDPSEYTRLDEREIRVLELLPASDGTFEKNVIKCLLHQGRRELLPSYEALSYVWGDDAEADRPILVAGKTFLVKRNLQEALQRFRPLSISPYKDNVAERFHTLWERIRLLICCHSSGDKSQYISSGFDELMDIGGKGYTKCQEYFEFERVQNSTPRAREVDLQSQQLLSLLNFRLHELERLWNVHATAKGKARVRVNSRFLWIDAICINQNDAEERANQIELMRQLYQNAASVMIWLGDDDGDGGTAIELMTTLGQKFESSILDTGSLNEFDQFLDDPAMPWYSIVFLFTSPWFERSWTVQEYLASRMGQRTAIFYYGSRCISWKYLDNISTFWFQWNIQQRVLDSWFYHPRKYAWSGTVYSVVSSSSRTLPVSIPVRRSIGPLFAQTMGEWLRLCRLSTYSIRNVDHTSLLSWLVWIRIRKATDPRDKIYSILGLLADVNGRGELIDVQMDELILDYNASVQDIYSSLVRAIVLKTNSLQILGACSHRGSLVQRSWTPDWSQEIDINLSRMDLTMDPNAEDKHNKYWTPFLQQDFQAAAHSSAKVSFAVDLTSMSAVGIFWDTIEARTDSPCVEGDDDTGGGGAVCEWLSTYIPSCYLKSLLEVLDLVTAKGAYGEKHATSRAIWRTLMVKWLLQDPSFMKEYFEDPDPNLWKQPVWEFLNEPNPVGKDTYNMTLERYFQVLNVNPKTVADVIDLVRKVVYLSIRFRSSFVVTKKGYAGQAMDRSKVGDIICVLLGSKLPVVLRPVEDHYEFIGEIYLEGIMHGEAIEATASGETKLQTFELR